MGASWTSSPRSTVTSCGALQAHGRWLRWWPGRPAPQRANANTIATVAHRLQEFPRCAEGMREGRLSLDQVGVIAARAGEGSDEHYAALAAVATVNQLRTAVKLEPRPEPDPRPEPQRSITKTTDEQFTYWRIKLPNLEAAKFDAALASHRDALIAEWKRDHGDRDRDSASDAAAAVAGHHRGVSASGRSQLGRRGHPPTARPAHHGGGARRCRAARRGTASGPATHEDERRYLTCDATCEVWFHRDGEVIGAGRSTRADQPAASPRARTPRPRLRGSRLRSDPRPTRPPHRALGIRRAHRAGQPRAGLPLPPPPTPSRHHHDCRPRRTDSSSPTARANHWPSIAGPSTDHTTARGRTMPRTHR